ncbi:ion transport protein [Plasmopara halstedii]|uniref:Ion transport protein n=1 Tax=Plasmopara halstedii TaxID=4781 RepID=A0A0P1AP03_PLAHL|nr:ion transport protein [Plasmopara halstedii]CEG42949.1 ion transport protein [Plasmopara halstedii]|eukprot:XP_024579318.1 ion transport protein [Plasmopara halstedii]
MLAARAAANRKVADARRAREALEWNTVRDHTPLEEHSEITSSANHNEGKPEKAVTLDQTIPLVTAQTSTLPSEDGKSSVSEKADLTTTPENDENDIIHRISLVGLTGARLHYVMLSNIAIATLNNTWFNSIVMLCISWASLSVGLQTYPVLGESVILNNMDFFVLAVFILEACIKILAEGLYPWRFFTGKEMRWNCFDFAIIIMSLPIWGSALGGSSIAILRMLRLMRIMKLVKRIPQLYMIVMGLIGGLKSIGYIMLLLFLVFYLYAISGMYAWQDNDTFHFRSVPIAMITLFRMSTLENWSAIMDINYFGCDRFAGGYYSTDPAAAASFQYCNATRVYGANVTESSLASQRAMNQVVASLYFITFILISAFVMLSLFIGAITMSMTQSMENMKKAQEEAETKKRAEKARKRALEAEQRLREAEKLRAAGVAKEGSGFNIVKTGKLSAAERRERQKMREVLMQTWDDCDLTDILTQQQGDTRTLKGTYLKVAGIAMKIVEHPKFSLFVTCVIILAGLMVGLQTSADVVDVLGSLLSGLDTAILSVFTAEVVLKILAEGLEPWNFFRGAWNFFDFVIVVGSFTRGSGGMLTMLRLLRLLRVLKLVRAFPQLQVIVSALIKGVGSIGYIGLILLLCFYVFGIVGNMLFAENDPFHFQYLHFAMISLFQLATMDGWSDVLYINYYGCDLYGYDDYRELGYQCKHQPTGILAVLYFCSFIVLGAMVLITLFIGVVTTSMEEATQEMEAEKEMLRRVEALRTQHNIDTKVVSSYMQVFHMLDLDGSGSVEEAELRTGLAAIGKYPSYEELKEMMDVVDEDGSGQIDIVEFVEFMIHVREKSNQQHAARLEIEAEEKAVTSDSSSTDPDVIDDVETEEASSSGQYKSLIGNEAKTDSQNDAEVAARVLAISTKSNDEINIAPFVDHPSRSWPSPRTSFQNGRIKSYSDKGISNLNGEAKISQTTKSTMLFDVEAASDDKSEIPLLAQAISARQRSGRVTNKIVPST